ncbi:MAG: DUF6089 family protein [Chitinophagales bacterium]|jgi:hypothetical protein|nr:DUF6089 family protein [Sphingobacteriales bacterium]
MYQLGLSILLVFTLKLSGQAPKLEHEIGIGAGFANYYGDLNTQFGIDAVRPAATVFWRGNYGYRFCLKTSLSYMQLAADDANSASDFQKQRNLSFHSTVTDVQAQVEFNFLKYVKNVYYNEMGSPFTPYLSFGAGVLFFNPKTYFKGQEYALQPLGTEGQTDQSYTQQGKYHLYALSINYGCGIKFHVKRNISLGLDFRIHRTMTDYLDDVSGKYISAINLPEADKGIAYQLFDRSKELGPAIGSPGRQRGSMNGNDDFANLFLTISWTFFSPACPGERY